MKKPMLLLIIILGIVLGIGIIGLNTNNLKEGMIDDEKQAQALGANIDAYANSQLKAAGIEPNDRKDEIMSVFNQMAALIATEKAAMGKNGYDATPDNNDDDGEKFRLDTTGGTCPDKTFLTGKQFSDGFCMSYYYDPEVLNQQCNQLTADNCKATSCCVLLNGKKCAAGDAKGPAFTPDQDYDYYIYKYKKYEKK